MYRNQRAFTMIELLVSATIIILLTAAGLVSFTQAAISSRNAKRKADLETIRQSLTLYKQDNSYYSLINNPSFDGLVTALHAGEYLSEPVLTDPKGVAPYIYQATCSSVNSGGNCVKLILRAVLEPNPGTTYDIIAL